METMTRSFSRDVDVNSLSLRLARATSGLARATSARVDLERALALAREESRDATLARDAATEEARRERACAIDAIDALEACAVSERAWRERAETWRGKFERARDAARRARRALELRELREAKEAKTVAN